MVSSRREHTNALHDFAASGLPDTLVQRASEAFPGAGVTFYSWDSATMRLVPVAANETSLADGLSERTPGVGASGRAAMRRRPVIANDYAAAFADWTPAAQAGVVAAMSVPLLAHGELVGTLSVGSDNPAFRFACEELATLLELQSAVLSSDGSWHRGTATARLAELEALCDAHHRAALGVACALVGDVGLAEQAVQDVLLIAWRTGSALEPGTRAVRPWLLEMVRRRSIRLRESAPAPTPAAWSHNETTIIDLIYAGGLRSSEVAEWLGISVNAVASTVRQALDRVHASIESADIG